MFGPSALFLVLPLGLLQSPSEPLRIELEVDPGGRELYDVPLAHELRRGSELPEDADLSRPWSAFVETGDAVRVAQAEPLFEDEGGEPVGLVVRWVEGFLGGEVVERTLAVKPVTEDAICGGFAFRRDSTGLELTSGERLVWRHERDWDPERYEATYKPFHHLGDLHGESLLTKGSGGLYPHHRGLFVGWGKTRVGDRAFDFWHMPATGAHQEFVGEDRRREAAGPVFARSISTTRWVTAEGDALVEDVRDLVAYEFEWGRIFDFVVTLRALDEPVRLDGDPAHAGVQLRLAQSVAEASAAEYFFPASATGGGGDNWSDCPWVAVRFPVDGERYEVLFLDHPENPRPTVFNTRAYGRFGPFFRADVTPEEPLVVRYRIYLQEIDAEVRPLAEVPAVAQMARNRGYNAYANPPIVRRRAE